MQPKTTKGLKAALLSIKEAKKALSPLDDECFSEEDWDDLCSIHSRSADMVLNEAEDLINGILRRHEKEGKSDVPTP